MLRWLFLVWIICLEIPAIEAQVKDTLRENINYRGFRSFSEDTRKPSAQAYYGSRDESRTLSILDTRPKDTLRDAINYRRNVGFYRSYKFKRGSMVNHYFGLQVNSIFHELSRPDSTYIENPFVLTYSVNHKLNGYGLTIGYGYTEWGHKYFNSADDEVASVNSRLNFRFGLEKKMSWRKRLMFGVGLDVVYSQNKFIEKTFIGAFVDEVYDRTTGWGVGPRASILVHVTRRIFIGTEAAYYVRKLKSKSYTQFTGLPPDNVARSSETKSNFLAPISLFLAFRI